MRAAARDRACTTEVSVRMTRHVLITIVRTA